ncbi:MAG: N-acetylmuramoyl-L-alanine amidase [Anaerovoracaceae bacterium]|nr:N-acetylmuramoyl-L-alanine amidase [Anaerovoracaceae bacterium]
MAKKIYLDAGHGGNDPGAVGYVVERKVAVKVVKYMKEYLQKNYVCKLKLSKGTAALSGRCREANNWKAICTLQCRRRRRL